MNWRALAPGLGLTLLATLAILVAALPVLADPQPSAAHTNIVRLERASLEWRGQTQTVRLPHGIEGRHITPEGERLRYMLMLDLPRAPEQALALYISRVARSARINLNGHDLGGCAPGALEAVRCTQVPIWLHAPPVLWRVGENRIEVEVHANRLQVNGLAPVAVGPAEAVYQSLYRPASFWRQDLVFALQWVMFAVGALLLAVGTLHRGVQRPLFIWFGLACVLRGVANFYASVVHPWDETLWSQWVFTTARLVSVPVMLLALVAFVEQRIPSLERLLMAYAIALPVMTAASGARTDLSLLLALPGVAATAWLMARVAGRTWSQRQPTDILMLGTMSVLLAAGLHDAWILASPSGLERQLTLPLTNGLLLVTLGSLIIGRMAQALASASTLNALLTERVADAQAGLQRQHLTILDLERRQARAQEREQLLRDLHDGLGSSLASARMLLEDRSVEARQMRQLLDDCIDDMRLLLDTSSPQAQLPDAMGNLRYRMDQRLQGSGLAIAWDLPDHDLPPVPPGARLQLLRIVQEALTNALRHANAQHIDVRLWLDTPGEHLCLAISDDGCGIAAGARPGRGLTNMRHRAQQIGARLALHSAADGTRVELEWPLQTAAGDIA